MTAEIPAGTPVTVIPVALSQAKAKPTMLESRCTVCEEGPAPCLLITGVVDTLELETTVALDDVVVIGFDAPTSTISGFGALSTPLPKKKPK